MQNQKKYIMQSLELHLFFSRIMKEHSLFLQAGFTPANASFAKRAEWFKMQFEQLLADTVSISNQAVCEKVLTSGEIVTDYTLGAEKQTSCFTGIGINTKITRAELMLKGINDCNEPDICLFGNVKALNRRAEQLVKALIEFKENILCNVKSCNMFTMNYPLLIEHILREAKLYLTYITAIENGILNDQFMKDTEQFWNRIMMEHAMFIRGLLDPSEAELIETSDKFAKEYASLLSEARSRNELTQASLNETLRFRDFKEAGTEGIQNCKIESVILPLLADHVLREANHYIRLLEAEL
ncbi:MAG: DUF2935 domain-containing protein [Clostridia bacterium]|nr:DUF2935 domain-containing protein [Clostridia bacterium]